MPQFSLLLKYIIATFDYFYFVYASHAVGHLAIGFINREIFISKVLVEPYIFFNDNLQGWKMANSALL
jgi:hypothetical protein